MEHSEHHIDWKKYVIVFFITASIFGTAIYANQYFNTKRIDEIKSIQDSIATNIMSSETEVTLLSDIPCQDAGSTMLSNELNQLAEKIEYSEKNIGTDNRNVVELKKFYSLLEIKDYLLMKKISERCGKRFVFALYFYAEAKDCPDCDKASYVLTYLRQKYPELRVYSFDYNLDLSAVKTMISMFKIKNALPAIVIDGEVFNGFQEKDSLEKLVKAHYPKIIATSTPTTNTK